MRRHVIISPRYRQSRTLDALIFFELFFILARVLFYLMTPGLFRRDPPLQLSMGILGFALGLGFLLGSILTLNPIGMLVMGIFAGVSFLLSATHFTLFGIDLHHPAPTFPPQNGASLATGGIGYSVGARPAAPVGIAVVTTTSARPPIGVTRVTHMAPPPPMPFTAPPPRIPFSNVTTVTHRAPPPVPRGFTTHAMPPHSAAPPFLPRAPGGSLTHIRTPAGRNMAVPPGSRVIIRTPKHD